MKILSIGNSFSQDAQRYFKEVCKSSGIKNAQFINLYIGGCSLDCDALSTVCLLSGTEKGTEIIENSDGLEAVFIDRNGGVTLTSGLYRENNEIIYKR